MNYFDNRSTNASAESFNAKIKAFRSKFKGVRNVEYFPAPQAFVLIPQNQTERAAILFELYPDI
ncbi:transposase [Flavobacterium psychroterrae]|uniref:transposase n=1 Tax=Flavobacterium psychroterrae TaxID=2133767 RepID=UPI0021D423F1|nr:transposase [Flavobacterium psychroterrae]